MLKFPWSNLWALLHFFLLLLNPTSHSLNEAFDLEVQNVFRNTHNNRSILIYLDGERSPFGPNYFAG